MFTDEQVIEAVKAQSGAEDVRIEKKLTENFWIVLASFPDGPDAYRFVTRMVDVSGDKPRFLGFNF